MYLVYWGTEWAKGFTTADSDGKLYSSKTLQNYVNTFAGNVGGTPYANIQTQYCNGVLPGSTSCVGGTGFVTNPRHQLKGVWTDPTPVPSVIMQSESTPTARPWPRKHSAKAATLASFSNVTSNFNSRFNSARSGKFAQPGRFGGSRSLPSGSSIGPGVATPTPASL